MSASIAATRGGTPAARGGTAPARGGAPAARGGAAPTRGGAAPARGGAAPARGGAPAARGGAAGGNLPVGNAPLPGGGPLAAGGAPAAGGGAGGRRILIFCDGTNEDASAKDLQSNVARLATSIAAAGSDGKQQFAFYQQGLGTSTGILGAIKNVFQLTVGKGMDQNIQKIYDALSPTPPAGGHVSAQPGGPPRVQEGDVLCFFGFSRGAATARFAADFIATVGFPEQTGGATTQTLYNSWLAVGDDSQYKDPVGSRPLRPTVQCVGVFDTVEALSVPQSTQKTLRPQIAPEIPVLSRKAKLLHPSIAYGFQALALHEMRLGFLPELWTAKKAPQQILHQTWFIGKHFDIGGGPEADVPNSGLTNATFRWMVAQMEAIGIGFAADVNDVQDLSIPQSQANQGHVLTQGKLIGKIEGGEGPRTPGKYAPGMERVHISVRNQGLLNLNENELPTQPTIPSLIGTYNPNARGWVNGEVTMEEDGIIAPPEGTTTAQTTKAPIHPLPSVSSRNGNIPRGPPRR